MSYLALRHLHITCVTLSITLFVSRGVLQMYGVNWRRWTILKVAPHVIDTVLLGSAAWLATMLHQYPFVQGWITAKVIALVAYVLLGKKALSPKTPELKRPIFFAAALLCVGYIVGVAIKHSASWGLLN